MRRSTLLERQKARHSEYAADLSHYEPEKIINGNRKNFPRPPSGLISDDASALTITCSLVSTRMSPNQTCDDLPGAGRVIDTYFYQPAGRFLERRINRILTKRGQTRTKQLPNMIVEESVPQTIDVYHSNHTLDESFRTIHQFFQTLFLASPISRATCRHTFWFPSEQTSIVVALSEYLFTWGAKDLKSWEDESLQRHCEVIMDVAKSPNFTAKVSALADAFFLLDSFPRLRRYFILEHLHLLLRDADISKALLNSISSKIGDKTIITQQEVEAVLNEQVAMDDVLRRLAEILPDERIEELSLPREILPLLTKSFALPNRMSMQFNDFVTQVLQHSHFIAADTVVHNK